MLQGSYAGNAQNCQANLCSVYKIMGGNCLYARSLSSIRSVTAKAAARATDRSAARWMPVVHWWTRIKIVISAGCARRAQTV